MREFETRERRKYASRRYLDATRQASFLSFAASPLVPLEDPPNVGWAAIRQPYPGVYGSANVTTTSPGDALLQQGELT
ncbi:hypothetical protein LIA77_10483 [Sarocladium implicatum]|nr:hypothetical protein LIA77_10483 [Sarocladium implicatum]